MSQLYVHLDSVSNHVLSSFMSFSSETLAQQALPKNILLLKGRYQAAIYDDYTGFYYIKDSDKIMEFLQLNAYQMSEYNWIDFESIEFLHQLSPQEIADLLYISHANTHLHSPFFYKLQNNFIYLSLSDGFTKVYFRKMDEFYTMLAKKLTDFMSEELTNRNRKLFFSKIKKAERMPEKLVKELVAYLKFGLVFALEEVDVADSSYEVPLYLAEDRYHVIEQSLTVENQVGILRYEEEQGWSLLLENAEDYYFAS